MRFVLLCLLLEGCLSPYEPSNEEIDPQITEKAVVSIDYISGSGGVWTKEGPVLVDRLTGEIHEFKVNKHQDLDRIACLSVDQLPIGFSYGATGIASGDIDNDSDLDFFVTAESGNPFLAKHEGPRLIEATKIAGVLPKDGFKSTSVSAFADIDNDDDLDLYIGQSKSFASIEKACSLYQSIPCVAEQAVGPHPNILFLNDGTGHFTEALDARGASHPGATLGLAFGDLDNDDDLDLYLANDFGPDAIYENQAGQFQDRTGYAGILNSSGRGGMGVAIGDVDGDNLQDLYVTHFGEDTLFLNKGNFQFVDVSKSFGVLEYSQGTVGWDVILEDWNEDGLLDVVVARGLWDPDAATYPLITLPSYTIAYNKLGKKFSLAHEGPNGPGAWGLVSSGKGDVLILSPFYGQHTIFVHRE